MIVIVEQLAFNLITKASRNLRLKRTCKPFIKWAGGKSQLLPELTARIPTQFSRYFEPFVGGGALYFYIQPEKAYLSDSNAELMNTYEVVKSGVHALIKDLRKHIYEKEYYYALRNVDRTEEFSEWSNIQKASRLIYLNKTCYNGLYRVNSKGFFNTPFGKYDDPTIVDEGNLLACSKALRSATIVTSSFEWVREKAKRGDFIYFDPPYAPINKTSYFTSYNKDGFDFSMQQALHTLCVALDRKKIKFMVSNSSMPAILKLYKNFNIDYIKATRAINSKAAKRGRIDEVIVTNY